MLEATGLTKEYCHCGRSFYAVDHVDFHVSEGEFIVLKGQSGCGKSTLFHMLTGLTKPTEGSVLFKGQRLDLMTQKELAVLRSTSIGYILQGQNLLPNFTIGENICMPLCFGKQKEDTFAYGRKLLEDFGLGGMENEMPSALSGGEQRRISIIRTLVHRPELVIADEPTSNLDEENSEIILSYLKKISEAGTTVILSSHAGNAIPYGDHVWMMKNGVITGNS